MKKSKNIFIYLLMMTACVYSHASQAQWTLSNHDSVVSFVSNKNASVAEVHTFKKVRGKIDATGLCTLNIELDSVNTLIQIRDQRMRNLLLETNLYPHATLKTTIDAKLVNGLKAGMSTTVNISVELGLHGKKKTLVSRVSVVALNDNRLLVNTLTPLVLDLADYDLLKGVNALKSIAKLASISSSVAVSAQFVFLKTAQEYSSGVTTN